MRTPSSGGDPTAAQPPYTTVPQPPGPVATRPFTVAPQPPGPAHAQHSPTRIGPYEVFQLLGEGGMGRVFLARSPGSRLVALKVIRPEYADAPDFRGRFRRETEAARSVSGFFTPPVLDADADAPQPWLATAYVPAPSLHEVVRGFGVLPEPALRALGTGLAEALLAIHAAGIVHRDLKPGNVLVAEDGPRVIDFGISRAVDATQVTRTGAVMGTPGFMAPEQIVSSREAGPAADVFSLGCVLVFAATGQGPFGAGGRPRSSIGASTIRRGSTGFPGARPADRRLPGQGTRPQAARRVGTGRPGLRRPGRTAHRGPAAGPGPAGGARRHPGDRAARADDAPGTGPRPAHRPGADAAEPPRVPVDRRGRDHRRGGRGCRGADPMAVEARHPGPARRRHGQPAPPACPSPRFRRARSHGGRPR